MFKSINQKSFGSNSCTLWPLWVIWCWRHLYPRNINPFRDEVQSWPTNAVQFNHHWEKQQMRFQDCPSARKFMSDLRFESTWTPWISPSLPCHPTCPTSGGEMTCSPQGSCWKMVVFLPDNHPTQQCWNMLKHVETRGTVYLPLSPWPNWCSGIVLVERRWSDQNKFI